jgi:hypothetical protein
VSNRMPNLKWRDWRKEKPLDDDIFGSAGIYLVWSPRKGVRLTSQHPCWWNMTGHHYRGERVRLWYFVGPPGLGMLLGAKLK